ncbi:MAG: OB-fold domain-containing protein [Acidimicrobiales bacterium]|nr:OB-fold domain-containing protein [Acidimicrobiales bacterium]
MTNTLVAGFSSEFWERAQEGVLVRPVCQSCQKSFFSPQVLCPRCQSDAWEYKESSGTGAVYSFTVIHRPPDIHFPSPLVVADIQLDEGWRMFSWIVGISDSKIELNDRVKVAFINFSGRKLPVFELAKEAI